MTIAWRQQLEMAPPWVEKICMTENVNEVLQQVWLLTTSMSLREPNMWNMKTWSTPRAQQEPRNNLNNIDVPG